MDAILRVRAVGIKYKMLFKIMWKILTNHETQNFMNYKLL